MKMELSKAPLSDGRENRDKRNSDRKCMITQIMTATGPIMSTIASGMTSGFSAILLPQLKLSNSTNGNLTSSIMPDYLDMNKLTVTGTEEESWVAASAALAMAPGCWMAGVMMEKFGRRGSYLITSPLYAAAWLMVGLAPNTVWLIIGRFLSGLFGGFNGPLSPVYIAETTEPGLRGIFLAGISLAIAAGVMLSHLFGTWLHWRVSALLCGLFPVLCFIFCGITPESPTWLMKKNKSVKARKVWIRLRGEFCDQEFAALQSTGTKVTKIINDEREVEKSREISSSQDCNIHNNASTIGWKDMAGSRGFMMPLFILTVFFFVSQFSGANAVVFYSVDMFKDVAGDEHAYMVTLILDTVRIIFSIMACWLTRNYRRRLLAILSGIGTLTSLFLLSGSLFTGLGKPWLSICFLFTYMCSISIGLVPLPWLLCGELFATRLRGLGSGLTSGFAFMFFFIVVKSAPGMMADLGASWTFAFYGIIVSGGTIFLYFFLPETKGKTLTEIEDYFTKQNQNRKHEKFQNGSA